MGTKTVLVAVLLLAFCGLARAKRTKTTDDDETNRAGKVLSFFSVITFPNDPCNGGTKNGTCYTAAECSQKGGTNSGSCANGFGVCCVFTIGCGSTIAENCTYFDSSTVTAGGCSVNICPCSNNICQLRLDFINFIITGPSTVNVQSAKVNGQSAATNSQCLTDTFSVTNPNGNAPPVICGTNTGEHMYVDASQNCNTLAFQLGNMATGTNLANRAWSIKVSQYPCDYPNLAPQGCTQYYFGPTSGTIQSYNYNNGNGQQLANQNQVICVRRERAFCRICFYAVTASTDFAVSGPTAPASAGGFNTATACCGSASGVASKVVKGYDCVMIPGAMKKTTMTAVNSQICGRGSGLVTATISGSKSICSSTTPFRLAFVSDAYEYVTEAGNADAGFTLGYTMDSTNCPTGTTG